MPTFRRFIASSWLLRVGLCLLSAAAGAQIPAASSGVAVSDAAARYQQLSAQTRDVAERYVQAYMSRDWPRLFPLMAERIQFSDPTAKLVFGDLSQQGKPALMKYFSEVYPYVETHAFKRERSTFAGQHAIFIGESDWSIALPGHTPVRSQSQLVLALKIEDGLVLEHLELADLQGYLSHRQRMAALPKP